MAYVRYGLVILLLFLAALVLRIPVVHRYTELLPCRMIAADGAREECVYAVILKEMIATDTGKALELFSGALPLLPSGQTKYCHSLAHRVGDMAYYRVYVFDSEKLRISDSFASTVCDYGFYHGFYEHLFQEHPSIPFMLSTCDSLPTGPEQYKENIRKACFHGIGHGLVLAQADVLPKKDWGDIRAFADGPLARCKELTGPPQQELRSCQYGVFAEIGSWSIIGDYGFFMPEDQSIRYKDCLSFENPNREYCVASVALMSVLAFDVENTLTSCTLIQDRILFGACVDGMIPALFAHSATDDDMRKGVSLCTNNIVASREESIGCFDKLLWALTVYYPESKWAAMCQLFPSNYHRENRC